MFWKCSDISKLGSVLSRQRVLQMSLLPRAVSFPNEDYRGLFRVPEMSCKGSPNWGPPGPVGPGNVPRAAETRDPSGPDKSLGPVDPLRQIQKKKKNRGKQNFLEKIIITESWLFVVSCVSFINWKKNWQKWFLKKIQYKIFWN